MARDFTNAVDAVYSERNNLLVLALTGRTGSGCTTTAKILSGSFDNISISKEGLSPVEHRKQEICSAFAKSQWLPFKIVSVSTLIFSYLLHEDEMRLREFLTSHLKKHIESHAIDEAINVILSLKHETTFEEFDRLVRSKNQIEAPDAWTFYAHHLSAAASKFRGLLGNNYASTFQTFGDNIRKSGSALSSATKPEEIFSLITRVKRIIKTAGRWDRNNNKNSTRVVIDAVRNPLELVYLRDQFAAFYSIAITAIEKHRQERLTEAGLMKKEIENLDTREYSKKSLRKYEDFVSQNLQECIQKLDLFIHNNGSPNDFERTKIKLHQQIIRYVALILRPGLVTPTADERCMQLAFVAKLNSGCISRQVGSAITDDAGSIKAVGWNDVPRGQVPCLLRDVDLLLRGSDQEAFSEYETTNMDLRSHLSTKFSKVGMLRTAYGLNCPFCFKDAFNTITEENNQVHTRSLHAEENAFLQLAKHGNSGIAGGLLYTTASPCELCSKKAFQLEIKEIIYVDPYPGISSSHILASGVDSLRPKLRLFGGAVGNAYHRLYEAVLPVKDEIDARLLDDPPPTLL